MQVHSHPYRPRQGDFLFARGLFLRDKQTMECPVRHSVPRYLWSAIAPSQWLSHCGSFSTWVCPRLTRKGNALNTTPWTKSQTNNLIPHFFSTRFDTFQNQTYSTLTMLKRKSTAGEAAVAEARPRRSLRNAQPASEPEPVAASTPTVKESKKAQTKNTPKAAVKRGGRKTPQKVEEEPVGLFFISVSGWKGLFSTNAMSLPLAISTHDLAMPSPPAPNHTTSPSLT